MFAVVFFSLLLVAALTTSLTIVSASADYRFARENPLAAQNGDCVGAGRHFPARQRALGAGQRFMAAGAPVGLSILMRLTLPAAIFSLCSPRWARRCLSAL